ncbi:hypothetical protein ACJJTC_002091 [Scirpophaga incertulas]
MLRLRAAYVSQLFEKLNKWRRYANMAATVARAHEYLQAAASVKVNLDLFGVSAVAKSFSASTTKTWSTIQFPRHKHDVDYLSNVILILRADIVCSEEPRKLISRNIPPHLEIKHKYYIGRHKVPKSECLTSSPRLALTDGEESLECSVRRVACYLPARVPARQIGVT